MALSKAKKDEVIDLSDILLGSLNSAKDGFGIREKAKQKRIILYHYVVHALAFIIVVPYIIMLAFGSEISPSYSTTVSIVIGFYFAKSLFD